MERFEAFIRPAAHGPLCVTDHQAGSRLTIDPERGGLATEFVAGRPVFYMDESTYEDPSRYVRGGNPVLFPSLGRLTDDCFFWRGKPHTIPIHGLARNISWRVAAIETREDARITLRTDSTQALLAQYPFPFSLCFTYSLLGRRMTIRQRYRNTGGEPMPISFGFHPYFFLYEKATARLEIEAGRCEEMATGELVRFGGSIPDDREVGLLFSDLARHQAVLKDRGDRVTVAFSQEFRHLLVWSLPGQPFVCVEPWSACPNALNTGEELLVVPPGGEQEAQVCYSVE